MTASPAAALDIEVLVESPLWEAMPGAQAMAESALRKAAARGGTGGAVCLVLADDARLRALNAQWRGADKPTNVLSFPALTPPGQAANPGSGDIILAFETLEKEAENEEKPLLAHLAHLTVHGYLHLLGHDHETGAQARLMEGLETAILAEMGISDPYADRGGRANLTTMSDTESPNRAKSADAASSPPAITSAPEPNERQTNWLMRAARAVLGIKPGRAREDLEEVLEAASEETGFSPQENAMLKSILQLHELRVVDVMLPRADIIAVQQNISLGDLIKVFTSAAHSRLVVYRETLDDPIGMIHIRDVLGYMEMVSAAGNAKRKRPHATGLDFKAINLSVKLTDAKLMRNLLFVPPSMLAVDLLGKMQATHVHLALVVDEYGGTDGIVSMEDIVELIVGDIEDEHDEIIPDIVKQSDGSFVADGRASLKDITAMIGADFDVGTAANDVDTIGGYVTALAGRVPVRGELLPGPASFEIEVLDADPRRVKRMKVYRAKARRPARKRRSELTGSAGQDATPAPAAEDTARNP